ncbi:hypothetical protein TNCV_1618691 [Trichonephila clavipes]|nr:hypothetical protein TNCV_1618691 [Trichonephila clavipes]
MIQASPVPACVRSAVFLDVQVSSARIPECSCASSTNLKCIMTFLLRERKDVLLEVAKELRVEIDITLPKIEFKKRICQSKYYDEESVKCLLEGILVEKRKEREKQEIKEFEERRLGRERELERLRVQLRNKLNENKLKAGNRINDLANVCILSENRNTEVSESVNKCRSVINPVVNKSVENATSCDFEKKNCDPPVRWTNVSHPSEVKVRGTEKNNLFKIVEGKEINVNRSSVCDVKMKVGVCEGGVKTVAMGAQRVLGFHQLVKDKCDPSIVPEFLRSTSCGMTSARGHGAIVYCLNSGRFCEGDTRNRWRDRQVCSDVDKELWRLGPDGSGVFWRWTSVSRCGQGTMAPWARRLGKRGPGKGERAEIKDKGVRERERTEGGGETEKKKKRRPERRGRGEKGQESPGERTDGRRRRDGKERGETERDGKRVGERESEARLEWRKGLSQEIGEKKDDERRWR